MTVCDEENSHLRKQFLLQPGVVFLNHGSFGACPRSVFDTYQQWQRELEEQPVEFLGRRFNALMLTARTALAAYLHTKPDDLVFVPNATTGLNIVARSLVLQPGDEVLSTDHEYGAMDRTWRFLCQKWGAAYVNMSVPLPIRSAEEVVDQVWKGVTRRTKVLFISHITSPTALILPIVELIKRAHQVGILTIVDGAHAPGQIPLDLDTLGADFSAGNLHKWVCGPKGSAYLHVRPEVQYLVEPLVVSWGWQPEKTTLLSLDSAGGPASPFILQQEWQGTRDISAYLSVPAAIQFQVEHDWPRVRQECHELLRYARQAIGKLTGLEQICPDSPEWYAQMAAFPLPPCDAEELKRRLYDEYLVEVPIITWGGKEFVRVSIQGYNVQADVDALVDALKTLLPKVCR